MNDKESKTYTLDDTKASKTRYSSVCLFCRHYHGNIKNSDNHSCDAFPKGIPYEIWCGENDHSEPFPGDHGIRCEARHK